MLSVIITENKPYTVTVKHIRNRLYIADSNDAYQNITTANHLAKNSQRWKDTKA
jgi:hypothetical protein